MLSVRVFPAAMSSISQNSACEFTRAIGERDEIAEGVCNKDGEFAGGIGEGEEDNLDELVGDDDAAQALKKLILANCQCIPQGKDRQEGMRITWEQVMVRFMG